VLVAHTCNPSYSAVRDPEDRGQANSSQDPISKNLIRKNKIKSQILTLEMRKPTGLMLNEKVLDAWIPISSEVAYKCCISNSLDRKIYHDKQY
jgi:hypothetical protein